MPSEIITSSFFALNEEGSIRFRRDNGLAFTVYRFEGDLDIAMGDEMKTAGITLGRLRQFTKDLDSDSDREQIVESLRQDLERAMGGIDIKTLRRTYDVLFNKFRMLRHLRSVLGERLTEEEKKAVDVQEVFGAIRYPGQEFLFREAVEGTRLSDMGFSISDHPHLVRILRIRGQDFGYVSDTLRGIVGQGHYLSMNSILCRESNGRKRYTITGV